MTEKVLSQKQPKQLIPFKLSPEFGFMSRNYRATLEIEAEISDPTISCSCCRKTTKKLLAAHGVTIAVDCSDETIIRAANDLHVEGVEALESTVVYTIKKFYVSKLTDLTTMLDVNEKEGVMIAIAKLIRVILMNLEICDGCMFDPEKKFVSRLLNGE